jgi:hypothetical protein
MLCVLATEVLAGVQSDPLSAPRSAPNAEFCVPLHSGHTMYSCV